jgi:hypothetical protein
MEIELRRQMIAAIRARLPAAWGERPILNRAYHAGHMALKTLDNVADVAASLAADRDLSDGGRVRKVRACIETVVPRPAREIRGLIAAARVEAAEMRARLLPPAVAPGDVVAALRQQELRGWLHGLDPGARLSAVFDDDTGELVAAVLAVPPVVFGLDRETHSRIETHAIERRTPGGSATLAEVEDGIEVAEGAAIAMRDGLRDLAALEPRPFDEWFSEMLDPPAAAA